MLVSAVFSLDKRADIGKGLAIDCHNADNEQEFDFHIYAVSTLSSSKNQPPKDASNVKHRRLSQRQGQGPKQHVEPLQGRVFPNTEFGSLTESSEVAPASSRPKTRPDTSAVAQRDSGRSCRSPEVGHNEKCSSLA
ncbi:hypothetical protein CH63R_14591 [Colletotrichum higginsianum IMI 349063]|uniref:Uncharacterized protein n=1 Tax=Colletotrichum higginsianum (strain IMI 349063) TaxID=759273 RepID=A0A1B7XQI4_COLHI|nr:hypothetical protein CH63R_14591 [Colletotrichum higginsianum IMI 349063]OBR02019.1 hypothetical protein CH63R_14591 [Colletotrichum higginsianum IMI 349063]